MKKKRGVAKTKYLQAELAVLQAKLLPTETQVQCTWRATCYISPSDGSNFELPSKKMLGRLNQSSSVQRAAACLRCFSHSSRTEKPELRKHTFFNMLRLAAFLQLFHFWQADKAGFMWHNNKKCVSTFPASAPKSGLQLQALTCYSD